MSKVFIYFYIKSCTGCRVNLPSYDSILSKNYAAKLEKALLEFNTKIVENGLQETNEYGDINCGNIQKFEEMSSNAQDKKSRIDFQVKSSNANGKIIVTQITDSPTSTSILLNKVQTLCTLVDTGFSVGEKNFAKIEIEDSEAAFLRCESTDIIKETTVNCSTGDNNTTPITKKCYVGSVSSAIDIDNNSNIPTKPDDDDDDDDDDVRMKQNSLSSAFTEDSAVINSVKDLPEIKSVSKKESEHRNLKPIRNSVNHCGPSKRKKKYDAYHLKKDVLEKIANIPKRNYAADYNFDLKIQPTWSSELCSSSPNHNLATFAWPKTPLDTVWHDHHSKCSSFYLISKYNIYIFFEMF